MEAGLQGKLSFRGRFALYGAADAYWHMFQNLRNLANRFSELSSLVRTESPPLAGEIAVGFKMWGQNEHGDACLAAAAEFHETLCAVCLGNAKWQDLHAHRRAMQRLTMADKKLR